MFDPDKLRNGLQLASGAMQGMGKQKRAPWYQSLGSIGQSVGDALTQHRANNAMKQDKPLHSAIDSVVGATPMPPAGPPPEVRWFDEIPRPDAPMDDYADGKIVTKPTTAIIGENGPEAVVPLGFRARAKVRPSMAGPMRRPFYGEV